MKRKLMFFMTFLFVGIGLVTADIPSYRCGNRRGRWPACCGCLRIGEWYYSWYYHGY